MAFLRQLSEETSYPLLVSWDNASIHRAKEVKGFLTQENAGWIHLEAQPAYSPELNADEQAWNWMKYHQLKNICCKTLSELKDKVQQAANRLKSSPSQVRSFFAHPERGFFNEKLIFVSIKKIGFDQIEITPFDWLHPSVPEPLIPFVRGVGKGLELTPGLRELAGSLYIKCFRPLS